MLDNTQGEHVELSNRLEAFDFKHSCQNITVRIRLPALAVPMFLLRPCD